VSVKQGLLALLAAQPQHGYQLKIAFEHGTGGVWPLNVGQVYTTLDRLVRDGLVDADDEIDDEGRRAYRLTQNGREQLHAWFTEAVEREATGRDELLVKVLLAAAVDGVDTAGVIQTQRSHLLSLLQGYRRRQSAPEVKGDLAATLALDALIARTEADARWLDLCEARLAPPPARAIASRKAARR
jgi:DNA-binding PadR family transcriptional regulator